MRQLVSLEVMKNVCRPCSVVDMTNSGRSGTEQNRDDVRHPDQEMKKEQQEQEQADRGLHSVLEVNAAQTWDDSIYTIAKFMPTWGQLVRKSVLQLCLEPSEAGQWWKRLW